MREATHFSSEDSRSTKEAVDPVKQRRRKNNLPDIEKNLNRILHMSGKQEIKFKATTKSSRGLHNGTSKRRSTFIGVLRNGLRWQVLINVGKKKKYIGTYGTEKEAAIVHDFYSIGLNLSQAKTNFSYDHQLVYDMVSSYLDKGHVFDPSAFSGRVE